VIKFSETGEAVVFNVRVVPNSSKSEIVGEFDGSLKIKIAAPPVDGAANAELIKVLAKKLGVAKSEVKIISGQGSKNKQVKIYNTDKGVLLKLLQN
jgi:uncharacterized protein (TIGR00251 family)